MRARWDKANQRWEASLGSGSERIWFRSKIEGEAGRAKVEAAADLFLNGPEKLRPGSLGEFLENDFWPWFKVPGRSTKSTRLGYMYAFGKQWAEAQDMLLGEIGFRYLQSQVTKMTEGDGLKAKTVHNKFSALVTVLELAFLLKRIDHNEWRLVNLPELEDPETESLSWVDALKVVSKAKGTPMEGPTWTALHLAARRNEVCGLKVPHVEVLGDRAIVSLSDNRQAHGEEPRLKGKRRGKKRVLVVPREWGERLLSFAEPGAVYLFHKDGKPVHPKWLTVQMAGLCKLAGVKAVDFHSLRHTGATALKNTGVREGLLSERILGHADVKTTQIYIDDEADEILRAFSALGSASVTP